MRPVLTPEQMSACDRQAIAAGTPESVLVERAAGEVARRARTMLGGTYGRRVTVVAGKGNNGNDGRVAARMLRAWGAGVDVHSLGEHFDRTDCARSLDRSHLVIDAMYGTGFRGRLEDDAEWAARAAAAVPLTLAVDVPSGVDGLTGAVAGTAVVADATVTFAALKPGLLAEPGRSHAGEVSVADIGVDPEAAGPVTTRVLDPSDVAALVPVRAPDQHKWRSGVLVVAGSRGMVGAALLVSRAALRGGAGMVVCAVPGSAAAERASGSEVVVRALPATTDASLAAGAAGAVLDGIDRFRAVAIGPGLGRDAETAAAIQAVVAAAPVPVVVDADGLHALAADPSALEARAASGLPPAVLTPHAGEFAALAGQPAGPDRIAAARGLATDLGVVVVLKGPATVVAGLEGEVRLNPTGGPDLASAGTGDVLTGVVAALLAQGLEPFDAAAVAVWLHGRAADGVGAGLVASDVADALPRTISAVRAAEIEER